MMCILLLAGLYEFRPPHVDRRAQLEVQIDSASNTQGAKPHSRPAALRLIKALSS